MTVTIEDVLYFCSRFDRSVLALTTQRRKGKPPFAVEDEYDMQDLVYAGLKPIVDDLVPEDPTGKMAGISGRLDLRSRRLGLVIEVKAALRPDREDAIPRECFERIKQYSLVPGMNVLAFFIHDPEERIRDADTLQSDLEGPHPSADGCGEFMVRVVGPRFEKTFRRGLPSAAASLPPRRTEIADADALNELESWFYKLDDSGRTSSLTLRDVDARLGLPDGTAKRLLRQAVAKHYDVDREGDETLLFKFRPRTRTPSTRNMGGF